MAEIGGVASSVTFNQQLSRHMTDDIDSLAAVIYKTGGLDLLTSEKGGTCPFLDEECCLYVYKQG